MRRIVRIIFNLLTVLSLLLCMATVVLWVRTEKRPLFVITSPWPLLRVTLVSQGGLLRLTVVWYREDVMSDRARSFRMFGPDETASNKLDGVYEASGKRWIAQVLPEDADGGELRAHEAL